MFVAIEAREKGATAKSNGNIDELFKQIYLCTLIFLTSTATSHSTLHHVEIILRRETTGWGL